MLVSIVMPVLNQRRYICQAVASVLEQELGGTGAELELVIADGVSTDGTLEWLRELERREDRVRVFSEPDTGPAQALNRALARVRGTTLGWLNADDLYAPGALKRMLSALEVQPAWLAVYGEGLHIDAEGRVLDRYPSAPANTPRTAFADGCFICQPTMFFRRTFVLLNGPLDETLRTAFDFDWWVRGFARLQSRIGFLREVQASSRLHADTITSSQRERVIIESMLVVARHLGQIPPHWVHTWIRAQGESTGRGATWDVAATRQRLLAQAALMLGTQEAAKLAAAAGLVEEKAG